jgi:WD40 repeat protein
VWQQEFNRHVSSLAFSADSSRLAVAAYDNSIYVIQTMTQTIQVLRGHQDEVTSAAFNPTRHELASGDVHGTLHLWDPRTAKIKHTLTGHTDQIESVSFGRRGEMLASSSQDKTVRLWNSRSGEQVRILKHDEVVRDISLSQDGRLLASGSSDGKVRLWNTRTGQLEHTLVGHTAGIQSVTIDPINRWVASGSADKTVRIWDLRSGEALRTLVGHTEMVSSVSFGPQGKALVSGGYDKTVRIWDVGTGTVKRVLDGHIGAVVSVDFSPNGHWIASASTDRRVRLWNARIGRGTSAWAGHSAHSTAVQFSPDGLSLASASSDKTVRMWDVHTGTVKRVLHGHTNEAVDVSFQPGGRFLATAGGNTVRIWNVRTGREESVGFRHSRRLKSVAFGPEGHLLATAGADNTVRIWDVEAGHERQVFRGHTAPIRSVDFSPDGRSLASGSYDETVQIWDVNTGQRRHNLSGHTGGIYGVRYGPRGNFLASGSRDKTVRIWDARTGQNKLVLKQQARAHYIDFHPDGRRVGVPCSDGVVRIWDIESQEVLTEFRGHSTEVNFLRFSPDGKLAATAGDDTTVRLWDVATGKPAWRTALLIRSPPRLLTHRGWAALDDASETAPGMPNTDEKWQAAVQKHARYASAAADGSLLCLHSFDDALEIWALDRDIRIRKEPIPGLVELRAVAGGCLLRTEGKSGSRALLVTRRGAIKRLATVGTVTAIGSSDNELFAAAGARVFAFDRSGTASRFFEANAGVSAVARLDNIGLAVGYPNGNIDILSAPGGQIAKEDFSHASNVFEQTPSSQVTRLQAGPRGALVAGFANGLVGLWNVRDRQLLISAQLHGPIAHLLIENNKLYAASSLGHHLVWDLRSFYADRCALLRDMWKQVPVVWRNGHAVAQSPPTHANCRP